MTGNGARSGAPIQCWNASSILRVASEVRALSMTVSVPLLPIAAASFTKARCYERIETLYKEKRTVEPSSEDLWEARRENRCAHVVAIFDDSIEHLPVRNPEFLAESINGATVV